MSSEGAQNLDPDEYDEQYDFYKQSVTNDLKHLLENGTGPEDFSLLSNIQQSFEYIFGHHDRLWSQIDALNERISEQQADYHTLSEKLELVTVSLIQN
jgi:hypothetical protein